MHTLIDCSNFTVIARHSSYAALGGLYWIQFANVDATILADGQNRNWSRFELPQLKLLASSVGLKLPGKVSYADALKRTRKAVETAAQFEFPAGIDEITQQAHCIKRDDDRPHEFVQDSVSPALAKKWTVDPQQNRARRSGSYEPAYPAGNAGNAIPLLDPENAPEHIRRTQPSAQRIVPPPPAKQEPAATSAKKKAPRAPAKPATITRPKDGTRTAAIWDIADKLHKRDKTDVTQLRKDVLAQAAKDGHNKSTASTQFGRWKMHQGL